VLATSRVPLGLLGEISYRLDPLDTDDVDSDGVRLFIERSGLVADDQLVDVVRLCQAVDGLPLAIELVASRTRHLPAAELADRIGHGVDLVSTRDPTLPERQRSLDRLLDWTLELLPVDERLLLARLAVIADSFDLPLAETVGADEGWTTSAVEELVWALLDWSLLTRDSASGTTRYSLLGTVRSHVLNRSDPDETGRARRRLAEALVDGSDRPGR